MCFRVPDEEQAILLHRLGVVMPIRSKYPVCSDDFRFSVSQKQVLRSHQLGGRDTDSGLEGIATHFPLHSSWIPAVSIRLE
jgi:hypothetical protein